MNSATTAESSVVNERAPNQWLVIGASSLGTVFEWYDFYIYGLLATILTAQFFSGVNETTGFIFALATFAAGFAVRPFGALVFGRLGDLVGRKHTFLITMSIMGVATFAVGLLPSYAQRGCSRRSRSCSCACCKGSRWVESTAAPRPTWRSMHRRASAGCTRAGSRRLRPSGCSAALLVVIGVRTGMGEEAFKSWGWRIPFLASPPAARGLRCGSA